MNTGQMLAVVSTLIGLSGQAVAGVINVPADQPTIQAAIDAAVSGDEVVVAPGTYNEVIDFMGKSITLRSSDGPELTIISGSGLNWTVVTCRITENVGSCATLMMEGFTIRDGLAPASLGGGWYNDFSNPTIVNCIFEGNRVTGSGRGGAIHNYHSSPTLIDCTFRNNEAVIGGAIYNSVNSFTSVTNCMFANNVGSLGG